MMRLINIVLYELNQDLFRDADHFSSPWIRTYLVDPNFFENKHIYFY
jgi:hypothetical protein